MGRGAKVLIEDHTPKAEVVYRVMESGMSLGSTVVVLNQWRRRRTLEPISCGFLKRFLRSSAVVALEKREAVKSGSKDEGTTWAWARFQFAQQLKRQIRKGAHIAAGGPTCVAAEDGDDPAQAALTLQVFRRGGLATSTTARPSWAARPGMRCASAGTRRVRSRRQRRAACTRPPPHPPPPTQWGGLDLNSSSSGCARLGSGVALPLGVAKEEVAVLIILVRRHRRAAGAAVRRAVGDEVPGAVEEKPGPAAVLRVPPGLLDALPAHGLGALGIVVVA